jgi:virginiamycin B lyase
MKIAKICIGLMVMARACYICGQSSQPVIPITQRAVATLKIPGFADFLVADGDAVWTTNQGRVEKLERDHHGPVATVPMPNPCGAMAIGFGSLWVANCQDSSLYRIDPKAARVLAVIPTGLADPHGELSIAVGAGSVWLLTDESGVLSRIDPQTNSVNTRIKVAPYSYATVFGFGSVWITNTGKAASGTGSVQRIDPVTNRVAATIPVGPIPRFLAAGEGGVWTLNQGDGSVSRIDPSSHTVVATITLGVEGSGGDIETGAGEVWVRGTKILLSVIQPNTNRVIERLGPPGGSGAVRVAGNFIWVTAHDIQTVWILPAATTH